jgi:ketosteroid isomerase-like protein
MTTTTQEQTTERVIGTFNTAFDAHDVEAVMATMTEDCVFEDTAPPDGTEHRGQAAVRAAWRAFFDASPDARFETEDAVVTGDRAVVRWTYHWGDGTDSGHVRGVDLFVVRDGKIAEKRSYVKG